MIYTQTVYVSAASTAGENVQLFLMLYNQNLSNNYHPEVCKTMHVDETFEKDEIQNQLKWHSK